MKKGILFTLSAFLCTSCYHLPTAHYCAMEQVAIGEPIASVENCMGDPYEIINCGEGREVYVYVERREPAPQVRIFHRYELLVDNGIIVDKREEDEEEMEYSMVQLHKDREFNGEEF